MSAFAVRTDLALEEGERIRESGVEIHGVILEEETRPETGILVTRVKIETKNGAKIMGKPIGTYVTLEAGQLGNDEEEYQQEVAKELSVQLQKLIPDQMCIRDRNPASQDSFLYIHRKNILRHILEKKKRL